MTVWRHAFSFKQQVEFWSFSEKSLFGQTVPSIISQSFDGSLENMAVNRRTTLVIVAKSHVWLAIIPNVKMIVDSFGMTEV